MTKLGIVSDVHNNAEALRYALDALQECDLVISLGDLVSQDRATAEIVRLARESGVLGLVGNHEKTLLAPCGYPARQRLAPDDLAFLQRMPAQRDLQIDGRRILAVHGAPWDDASALSCSYVFEHDRDAIDRLRGTPADIVLLGHTHLAMGLRVGDLVVFNPGSCGEPRGRARRVSFGVLDFSDGRATAFEVVPYGPPHAFIELPL